MSRIYEALQKAESERKSERREPEPLVPDPSASAGPFSAAALAEHDMRTMEPVVTEPVGIQPIGVQPYRESFAPPTRGDFFDLNQIVPHHWSLSLDQLPALLERGPAVEQFRSLRSRIFELRDISPLKTILISSGLPQEGKSFVSTNLALSLARHKNSKVLLIDGDMRRYTLHQILGCESTPGLADYLAGKATITEVMQRPETSQITNHAAQHALPNLAFIAGGNGGDKAADLSGSPRFGELIQLVSPHFDWIIVDSSPVLPVSDAVNLARFCDGVLLVARSGVTKFPVAQRAQSELKAAHILGFVLNAVIEAPEVGGYYSYDAKSQ
ncbi:MAG TPA: CpsD/CapB family tyrosine-protein kinase [Edaphobacter sp.]|jgi:protein-tyrosine kinase|nr:CpsD/CapB family tyrosine-protein kinase [Edaphobacter sp.]